MPGLATCTQSSLQQESRKKELIGARAVTIGSTAYGERRSTAYK
jgi:hypothetical protein